MIVKMLNTLRSENIPLLAQVWVMVAKHRKIPVRDRPWAAARSFKRSGNGSSRERKGGKEGRAGKCEILPTPT